MKKNTFFILIIFFFSCEDFLDEEPTGVPVGEDFYTNFNELQLGVNSIYQVLRSENFQLPYAYIGSGAGDNLVPVAGTEQNPPAAIATLNATSQDANLESFWFANYQGIARANLVIESGRTINPFVNENGPLWLREMIGEAKFLRAFFYFNLVRTFGGVPIKETVLNLNGNEDNFKQARSSVAEVYEIIEKDLREAIIALNDRTSNIGTVGDVDNLGTIGRGHAWCMLMKVFVYQAVPGVPSEKWEQARAVGEHIVSTQGTLSYREILEFQSLYNNDEIELSRVINDLFLTDFISFDNFLDVREAGLGGNAYTLGFQYAFLNREEADFNVGSVFEVNHTIDPSGTFDLTAPFYDNIGSANVFQPAIVFVDSYPNDPRSKIANGVTGTSLPDGNLIPNPPFPDKTITYKWYTLNTERAGVRNFRIMRYAEIVLFYAEALNETGDQFGAVEQLNTVKARARRIAEAGDGRVTSNIEPIDFTIGNYLTVRDEIRRDRRIELCHEFDRFWDLVRSGTAEEAFEDYNEAVEVQNKKNFRPGISELFPIPLSEIDASNGLVIQNPGY